MAGPSKIEWTEATWNPIVGCSILSPGCTNCYAMKMAARIEAMNTEARETGRNTGRHRATAPQYDGTTKKVNGNAVWTGKLAMAGDNILLQPLKRKKPTTYFVNSMGDLFHEDCPDEWIDKAFAVMALCPQHTFQVLTKRAERMKDYCSRWKLGCADSIHPLSGGYMPIDWPLPNVWLGVSTERQKEADERIPLLLNTPAAIRFISAEPLLGPIDLVGTLARYQDSPAKRSCAVRLGDPLINWVIVGGESGHEARPMHLDWARSLRVQCEQTGVPFFFKQWGEYLPWSQFNGAAIEDDPEQTRFSTFEWDGEHWDHIGRPMWCDSTDGNIDEEHCVARVGKSRAGRALDGIEYNEMPEPGQ